MKKYIWILIIFLVISSFSESLFISTVNGNQEIHLVAQTIIPSTQNQKLLCQEYKELTGIDLKITRFPNSVYPDKVYDFITNQKQADIIEVSIYDLEVFINSPNLDLREECVPLNKFIKSSANLKNIDDKHFDFMRIGKSIYGFPLHSGKGMVTYIRKDWLDNLGLKIPTTWEEFYAVLKAFTFNDPDGNKTDDTFGCTLTNILYYERLPEFLQGATPEFKKSSNNSVVDGFVQNDFLQALERLKKARKDGVFINDDSFGRINVAEENFQEGKTGVFCAPDFYAENIYKACKRNNEKAEVIAIECIDNAIYRKNSNSFLVIPKSCSNPRLVFEKIIEFMNDGAKGELLFTYGIENVNYKVEDNQYRLIRTESGSMMPIFKLPLYPLIKSDIVFACDENLKKVCEISRNSQYVFFPLTISENWCRKKQEIRELKEKTASKVIFDELTVEQSMIEYHQRAKELQVEQILKEFNAIK